MCGNLLTYSLFLIPNLLCFWIVASRGIADITAALWDFNNMPQLIYGKWMQRIGTFILPVFVITNFPGAVPHGTVIPRHDGLGRDFTRFCSFFIFAGDLEKGGKKLQLGQFLSDFPDKCASMQIYQVN